MIYLPSLKLDSKSFPFNDEISEEVWESFS